MSAAPTAPSLPTDTVPAFGADQPRQQQRPARAAEDPNKITAILPAHVPADLQDVIACKDLGGGEYRIGLMCQNDGPLRAYEAEEMAEKIAQDMFRLGRVGFDTNRHIVWEERIKKHVVVFKVSQS